MFSPHSAQATDFPLVLVVLVVSRGPILRRGDARRRQLTAVMRLADSYNAQSDPRMVALFAQAEKTGHIDVKGLSEVLVPIAKETGDLVRLQANLDALSCGDVPGLTRRVRVARRSRRPRRLTMAQPPAPRRSGSTSRRARRRRSWPRATGLPQSRRQRSAPWSATATTSTTSRRISQRATSTTRRSLWCPENLPMYDRYVDFHQPTGRLGVLVTGQTGFSDSIVWAKNEEMLAELKRQFEVADAHHSSPYPLDRWGRQ